MGKKDFIWERRREYRILEEERGIKNIKDDWKGYRKMLFCVYFKYMYNNIFKYIFKYI